MAARSKRSRSARRRTRRYIVTLVLAVALIGGWSWFWYYAAGKAEVAIDGWRAREAKAGRVYSCGSQSIGGYPFRIEVNCHKAAALLRTSQPPVEIKAGGMLIAAQIYQPESADHRIPRAAHRCRSGQSAVSGRELEAGAVERARHPSGARTGVDRARQAGGRTHRRRRPACRAARPARRNPRPHRRRLGRRQTGDRNGARASPRRRRPSCIRRRSQPFDADITAVLRRLAGFLAQALAGAVPRDAGGGRAHRHHASAACTRARPSRSATAACRSTPTAGCRASCA